MDRFLAAWERADVDELLDFFADDAEWHPGPMKPAIGKEALRVAFEEWLTGAVGMRAEVHSSVSDGRLLMHERTDHFSLAGQETATPVAAAFVVEGGLIHAWREYFDMSPFVAPRTP
ncbi:hypothetical protein A5662_05865 [Mycobacteriaceae bacterium 1482268.1]|nr:hypothetical protein A5662_05865 [Mycobacteriaceae bacterium 1482268.1]